MYQQTSVVEKKPVTKAETAARLRRFTARVKEARKDPKFVEAAREFYKYHTGKELKV